MSSYTFIILTFTLSLWNKESKTLCVVAVFFIDYLYLGVPVVIAQDAAIIGHTMEVQLLVMIALGDAQLHHKEVLRDLKQAKSNCTTKRCSVT